MLPMLMMRPPSPHIAHRFLRRHEQALDVDCNDAVEVVERESIHRFHDRHARVVDQDIQATEGLYRFGHTGLHGSGVARIGADCQCLAACCLNGADDFRGLVRRRAVGERHRSTIGCEAFCDSSAEAPRSAGDQCNFAHECLIHSAAPLYKIVDLPF